MSQGPSNPSVALLPVVLVGGASQRYGRDKLLEPIGKGGEVLVDRPIQALRQALGVPVAIVGTCDPGVVSRADFVIDDPYPGVGPMGGVLAALEHAQREVFVLAGDLPAINALAVRTITDAGADHPDSWAVIARTETLHPTIGLYRPACMALLKRLIGTGHLALQHAIPELHRLEVAIDPRAAANVNRPEDLCDHHCSRPVRSSKSPTGGQSVEE